jgi:hypothetical protein
LHDKDLRDGFGTVHLPFALAKKYTNAGREWKWHNDVATTMIYTHILQQSGHGVFSPLDDLDV